MKDRFLLVTSPLKITLLAIFLAAASLAASASDKVLYSFKGGDDGANPSGGLVADRMGNLYGTTDGGGGACNCGTVFVLSPPGKPGGDWVESILYRFPGGNDGASPEAPMIFDMAGNLYGTTLHGGAANDGTVFKLAPPAAPGESWTETTLYQFKGGQDGDYPIASLVFDTAGNLYSTTLFGGGPPQAGIVFQISPPAVPGNSWTETVLHRFGHGRDGGDPEGALLIDKHGALYGTTMSGVVFKLSPPAPGQEQWTERGLYDFSGFADGSEPSYIMASGGAVYGAATLGGNVNHGTIFQLIPQAGTWKENTLYSFQGGSDGGLPIGQLLRDRAGTLYGTTYAGQQPDNGTVFRLSPPAGAGTWTKTILHEFGGKGDGTTPTGGVIKGKAGALYGTTNNGGAFGLGVVYAVAP
ncbi:MAG: choice-of-anchor tandem repeat GloVer-containing protein [Terriglobales bacterium]